VDGAVAELADRQHGVVARRQLLDIGLSRDAIDRRVRVRRLHVVFRGAYAVGRRRVAQPGVWLAAVLACGPDAVLSHGPAAVMLGIREHARARIDVTVPRRLRQHDGIRPHFAVLAEDERTIHAGIPVTSVSRTLLDLAAVLQPHELRQALERAEAKQLTDRTPLSAVVHRHRGHRGVRALKAALEEFDAKLPRSELERRFLALVETAGLPQPRVNHWLDVGGALIQPDCAWPDQRLIVEVDGRAWHDTNAAFERDRRRDRRCAAAGWRVIRVTEEALKQERAELEEELRALLSPALARSA
jgi:very-short-patch-repair endonuclease